TLEEIAIENRDFFMAAGGEQYDYIPCLNDQSVHINALADIIDAHVKGWMPEQPESGEELQLRKRRAGKLGAKF
ncbi:MAG: ferrochelatase, partial [Gammaproteobacteria bacterium]